MDYTVTEIGKFKVIKPTGRIDWESARMLDKEILRLIEEDFRYIVFNLDEVKFICSGGIGALVYNLNKLKKNGGSLYIIADNDYITYVFETLRFDMIFEGCMFKNFEEFSAAVLDKEE